MASICWKRGHSSRSPGLRHAYRQHIRLRGDTLHCDAGNNDARLCISTLFLYLVHVLSPILFDRITYRLALALLLLQQRPSDSFLTCSTPLPVVSNFGTATYTCTTFLSTSEQYATLMDEIFLSQWRSTRVSNFVWDSELTVPQTRPVGTQLNISVS